MQQIQFTVTQTSHWAGMDDFLLVSPDGAHRIELRYAGEPPHGDSYHIVTIDERPFPGFAWGCFFSMSTCSRYAAFSWMSQLYERKTIVVDMAVCKYCVLTIYIYQVEIVWPLIIDAGTHVTTKKYMVESTQEWHGY